jgi:hypothetical protein
VAGVVEVAALIQQLMCTHVLPRPAAASPPQGGGVFVQPHVG